MKLNVISDLHLGVSKEYDNKLLEEICGDSRHVDALVICGDLAVGEAIVEPLKILNQIYRHIFYVNGNHESYDGSIKKSNIIAKALQKELSNFYFLKNDYVKIEGITFYGGTMWFSEREANKGEHKYVAQLKSYLNDFKAIQNFESGGTYGYDFWNDDFLMHLQWPSWGFTTPDVVISHHIPHSFGIPINHIGNPLNRFFYCSEAQQLLDSEIIKPKLWCYGHTHSKHDFTTSQGTRFVCNPVGYLSESTLKYELKIVEL